MPFRCVDCKEEGLFATMTTEVVLLVVFDEDGFLDAEIDWTWDVDDHKEDLRCQLCAGKIEVVSKSPLSIP